MEGVELFVLGREIVKTGYSLAVLLGLAAICVPSAKATEVTIEFGKSIEKHMNRLNVYEKNRELEFRDRRQHSVYRSPARWYGLSTAEERLVPDINDYSVETLARRMAEYNLEFIGEHETDRQLIVSIDDYYARNTNMNAFRGPHTVMKGAIRLLDSDGEVLFEQALTAYDTPDQPGGALYHGDGHPYPRGWYSRRIGPMFAVFLEKAMSRVYPDAEVPEAVFK